jgi:hypothetical protein
MYQLCNVHRSFNAEQHFNTIFFKGSVRYIHNIIVYERPTYAILSLCILVVTRVDSSHEYKQKVTTVNESGR